MIRKSRFVVLAGVVGLTAVGALVIATGVANARRLPAAYSGSPEPWGEAGCWEQLGPRLFLNCVEGNTHFFQVPLPIDTATTVNASRYHGITCGTPCLTFGTRCDRTTTYNANGTFFSAQGTNCTSPNNFVSGAIVAIRTNGTATLDTFYTGDGSTNNQYISDVVYTP